MSAGSRGRPSASEEEATSRSAGSRNGDRLAALISGSEGPTPHHVDELLLAWRHAQQEASDAYSRWRELAPRDGHAAYLAALDREERAAEVYAEVRRRALAWSR